ncbi:MAG: hypothetical protein F7B20_07140 [Aeropyrum sp.]|nr:hypothetical protein [Aeropyrum sp.]
MRLVPSIDVEGGIAVKRVGGVRGTGLRLGKAEDLLERLASIGFKKIHIVDLDGAKSGRITRYALGLASKARELGVYVRLGGGLRSVEAVEEACSRGTVEAVLGSMWLEKRSMVEELLASPPCRLVAAVEVSGGSLVYRGWEAKASLGMVEALRVVSKLGFAAVLFTDVDREGAALGVNRELVLTARREFAGLFYYAGGVSTVEDLEFLEYAGVDEAVVGMALYKGQIPVEVALSYA